MGFMEAIKDKTELKILQSTFELLGVRHQLIESAGKLIYRHEKRFGKDKKGQICIHVGNEEYDEYAYRIVIYASNDHEEMSFYFNSDGMFITHSGVKL